MPRRIVLHAGFHKTGTTSIQATLRDNRVALKQHIALRLRWHMQDLVHATRGFSTWRDPLTLIKAEHRFDAMLDALPAMPRRTLIISAEELAGHLPGRDAVPDYGAAPVLLESFWRHMTRKFPAAGITVYLTTRAPDVWLASAYWEHVKASSMTLDFDDFATRTRPAADLQKVAAEIADRVPCPVISTPLEACRSLPLGPADPLLDLCDLPIEVRAGLTAPPPANTRLGDAVLLALLAVNRSGADPEARKAAKAAILQEATAR